MNRIYVLAGTSMGLTLGLIVSRGHGVFLMVVLGTTLGCLLMLVTQPENQAPVPPLEDMGQALGR